MVGRGKRAKRPFSRTTEHGFCPLRLESPWRDPRIEVGDQDLSSKDCSGSSVAAKEREAVFLQSLKTRSQHPLQPQSLLELGTSSAKCRSAVTKPRICTDPFTSKTLCLRSSNSLGRCVKGIIPLHRWGASLSHYRTTEQCPVRGAAFWLCPVWDQNLISVARKWSMFKTLGKNLMPIK